MKGCLGVIKRSVGLVGILCGLTLLVLVEIHGVSLTQGEKVQTYWLEYLFITIVTLTGLKLSK